MISTRTPALRLLLVGCLLALTAAGALAQIGFQQLGVYTPEDPSAPVAELSVLESGWRVVSYQQIENSDKYTTVELPFKLKAPYDAAARAFVLGPATLNMPELYDLTEIHGYFLPNNRLVLLLPVISYASGYKLVHQPFLYTKKAGK